MSATSGQRITVVLATHEEEDAAPAVPPPSRRQQQATAAAQPFVQKAIQLFDADESRLRYIPPE